MKTSRISLVLLLAFAASIHCIELEWYAENFPLCKENNCQHGEPCVIMLGYNVCLCEAPYYGDNCEYRSNVCDRNLCLNGGTCVPFSMDEYFCYCPRGILGKNCEMFDHCKSQPCKNGGTCYNAWTKFYCLCKGSTTGYSEDTCETISE